MADRPPWQWVPLKFRSNFWGRGFLDFLAENPDQQAKRVVGFGVLGLLLFLSGFWVVVGVGFVLNCWFNARICGLIVADLCFVLQILENFFNANVLQ